QHRRRAVQPEGVRGLQAPVELGGQLPAAATEVGHPAAGGGRDEGRRVGEGGAPAGGEPLVLPGVPGVHAPIQAAATTTRQRPRATQPALPKHPGGLNRLRRHPIPREIGPSRELHVRMTVKAYLALLVGVFVVALLAVSLVQGNLVGDLAAVARDVTGSHAPRARAARELRAAHLVERRALAGFLLTAEPAESGPGTA